MRCDYLSRGKPAVSETFTMARGHVCYYFEARFYEHPDRANEARFDHILSSIRFMSDTY